MSIEVEPLIIRRHARYLVNPNCDLRVRVRTRGGNDDTFAAAVIDLSTAGAKLRVPSPLPFQEMVAIHFTSASTGLNLHVSGSICWIRQGQAEGEWILGCAFDPELPEGFLDNTFPQELLERRVSQRVAPPLSLDARARWELQPADVPVSVMNVSPCGFCVRTQEQPLLGGTLRMSVNGPRKEPLTVEGRVQWHASDESGHLVGCHVSHGRSFENLSELSAWAERAAAGLNQVAVEELGSRKRLFYYVMLVAGVSAAAAYAATWM